MTLSDESGNKVWVSDTNPQKDSTSLNYIYKIGLNKGTYILNIVPNFYFIEGNIETKHKYDFVRTNFWEIESNNSMKNATSIIINKTYTGVYTEESYETSYKDYYKVKLAKGKEYKLIIGNYDKLEEGTTMIYLIDPDGNEKYIYDFKEKENFVYKKILPKKSGTYYIKIDNDGYNEGVEYTVAVTAKPQKVSGLKVTKRQSNTLTLSWNLINEATGYKIYQYNSKTKKYNYLKTIQSNSIQLENLNSATTYQYKVRAYAKEMGTTLYGEYSNELKVTTQPLKVKNLISSTQTTTSITLKWDKVNKATGYKLYQYNTKEKDYKYITTLPTTSYKITNLKAGTNYKFKVKAYVKASDGTIHGYLSDELLTATKTITPNITASSKTKGKVTLIWKDVAGESNYQVYYSTKSNSNFKKYTNLKANSTSCTIEGLKSNTTYYFKIRTNKKVNDHYIYSSYSIVRKIKVK